MKQAIKRSVTAIILVALAIASGYGIQQIYYAIQAKNYPLAYTEYVEKYAKQYNVPEAAVYAVIKVESNFVYNAESYKKARGLMQLMPGTFEWLCQKEGLDPSEHSIDDPETNIRIGTCYLSFLYKEFEIWDTVFAAYNAGHGVVRQWLADSRYGKDGHLINIPYSETSGYVKKVSSVMEAYQKILKEKSEGNGS